MIRLSGVTKTYPCGRAAMRGVDLNVRDGELAVITGPSAAGKTTLLNIIIGLQRPDAGGVVVGGRNLGRLDAGGLAEVRREAGLVLDNHCLIARMSVVDNLALAGQLRGLGRREARERAHNALVRLDIERCAESRPDDLCAGERRRAILARALVGKPALILADEPTLNLDPDHAHDIASVLADAADDGTTVVVASNDMEILSALDGRLFIMSNGRLYEETPSAAACA